MTEKSQYERFRAWFNEQWAEWDKRQQRRTTQQELADYLGITRASVAQYARGGQVPNGENLEKIAGVFGSKVYEILGAKPPMPPEYADLFTRIKSAIEAAGVEPESDDAVKIANDMLDDFVSKRKSSL